MAIFPGLLTGTLAGIAAIFACLAFIRSRREESRGRVIIEELASLLRNEAERTRTTDDEQARAQRRELAENFRTFQEGFLKVFRELREFQEAEIKGISFRLDAGIKTIDARATALGTKLDQGMVTLAQESIKQRDGLRHIFEAKIDDSERKRATAAKELREEMTGNLQKLGRMLSETLFQLGEQQKDRLDNVASAFGDLSGRQAAAQEALRQVIEGRLDAMRSENALKLEEMRQTVDEKLQSTLETRLGESFNRVVEQLERVHKGIGEMQSLAAGVGDLKRVLTNVRIRGTFGEVQASTLLEQFLSPEQFIRNAQTKEGSQERVEFAVRLPGREPNSEVLLPVDAKFPQDDYERLMAAAEAGNGDAVAQASKDLETRVKLFAKTIRDKYIAPPRTTEFAILFLPTEGLYAEILRRPGLFEYLQREYHVTLTGPATLTAFLNALQMGFRSLAIERRASEVWQILGAVRNEFGKYNEVVDKLSRQLRTAARSVKKLGIRTRAMGRKLRDVENLPDETARILLGQAINDGEELRKEVPATLHGDPPVVPQTPGVGHDVVGN